MLRKTYDWVMGLAASRHAGLALGAVAFAEGIFFPVPADVLLMPVALANRDKALRYALLTTVCSICGGSVGYAVGRFLQPLGRWLLALTGHADAIDKVRDAAGPWLAALIATPIPYKITAITTGLLGVSFPLFIGVSIVVRGLRYGIEAALIKRYGAPIQAFIEKHMGLVATAIGVMVILLIIALKVFS
ncbi:MAG: DedA family protein [Phenylobacterium sp.]|nr:MAG: DedA family protein [Phenylobacterium sp.]